MDFSNIMKLIKEEASNEDGGLDGGGHGDEANTGDKSVENNELESSDSEEEAAEGGGGNTKKQKAALKDKLRMELASPYGSPEVSGGLRWRVTPIFGLP